MKFYPELKDRDEFVTEFTVKYKRENFAGGELDPDQVGFARPDFGFNDEMDFDQEQS